MILVKRVNKQRDCKKKKINKKNTILIVLSFFVVVAGIKAIEQQPYLNQTSKHINELNSKLNYEKRRLEQTKKLNQQATTDEYIEKIARDKLGLVKPGEKIFVDTLVK